MTIIIIIISYVAAREVVMLIQKQPLVQWPLVRHLPALLRNCHRMNEWGTKLFADLGSGTVVLKGPLFTGLELVLTCDPLNVEYVTKTNFPNFGKGPTFVDKFDVLGDGIFIADDQSWFLQRKMAHSRLTSKRFQSFYAEKSREAAVGGLVPVLHHAAARGSSLDLQEVFKRFSFDATCASIVGTNPRSLSVSFAKNEFSSAIDEITQAIFYRHLVPSFWWKAMRFLGVGWEGRGDKFFRDTALSFFAAGRDTLSSGLTWFFLLLCKTPSVEAKILEELKKVVLVDVTNTQAKEEGDARHEEERRRRPHWRLCSSEDIKNMVYLHAALLESMRLFPPVPVEHKGVREEDVLPDGTVVKPGDSIVYSIYVMGRMKWIWGEDCMDFKPERWIDEKGKLRHEPSSKYTVFNAGPRSCLGKTMAMTIMKMAAATVLLNFRLHMVESGECGPSSSSIHSIQQVPSVVLQVKNGFTVMVTEREDSSDVL
ncbi:hypothetical protein H6P81_011582 [Aristolochia fimbriata]|uniref:Cytochrome P450 n=1 Tax=Aristolochia fimbriata TaxID=158543 RepID=A0AAV7EVH1_ARIFI|nr:hypothetical protein H6P81_011582 [Aristolochia fimbriata]